MEHVQGYVSTHTSLCWPTLLRRCIICHLTPNWIAAPLHHLPLDTKLDCCAAASSAT
jgi:hypothetical protein